jgi:four helix bundle protein
MQKDLKERTKLFAVMVIRIGASLPRTLEAQVIGKQLLRSGTSVGANYREANRSRSRAEFVSKLGVVEQELAETEYWLEVLEASGIKREEELIEINQEAQELLAVIVSSIRTARRYGKRRTRSEELGTIKGV